MHRLHALYAEVYIAQDVWDELNAGGKSWPGSQEVQDAQWIIQHSVRPDSQLAKLRLELDRGEAESIIPAQILNAQP